MSIKYFLATTSLLMQRASGAFSSLRARIYKFRFAKIGKKFSFDPGGVYSYANISVGDNVNLGYRPLLIASRSKIKIGNNVMFGPEVTIRGGNHRIDIVGRYMIDIKESEKKSGDDPGVIIKDDVWIGTRAIILAGVTVGRGAVVAAGAVITKSVPRSRLSGGNPARLIRMRWPGSIIIEHESRLAAKN